MPSPILLPRVLPSINDPAILAILEGLKRATGAKSCRLCFEAQPDGSRSTYSLGDQSSGPRLVLDLDIEFLHASFELLGAGTGPAACPPAVEALRPLLEGVLVAIIERCSAQYQLELLAQVLGASKSAKLLIDPTGDILYANQPGEALLAMHTEQPDARVEGSDRSAPLLHLIMREDALMREAGESNRRVCVTIPQSGRWQIELTALPGLGQPGHTLITLSSTHLPDATDIHQRLCQFKISRRESEVLAEVLHGLRAAEIAHKLEISEYTVKDHLKHAYAKLRVTSRSQLLGYLADIL